MTQPTVLIAALSARALAQSARRAGFTPLVVDCYGDCDTLAAAGAHRILPTRLTARRWSAAALMQALRELANGAESAAVGLVLGSGFENEPDLIQRLADTFALLGNGADVVRATKDPRAFFATLEQLGVRHPETRLNPPSDTKGWLVKRVGGCGGGHIRACPVATRADPTRYFQRYVPGVAVSVLGMVAKHSSAFAISQQWTTPSKRVPFRYGGAAGSLLVDEELEARLISTAMEVADALGLIGLVSFDFLISNDEPFLLEVNPRPGATLDIFDDQSGTLFKVHVAACVGGDAASLLAEEWHPPIARASAFLYADRGSLVVGDVDWPDWAFDRPHLGSTVPRGQPIATVIVEGCDLTSVSALCLARLQDLERRVYGAQIATEP